MCVCVCVVCVCLGVRGECVRVCVSVCCSGTGRQPGIRFLLSVSVLPLGPVGLIKYPV